YLAVQLVVERDEHRPQPAPNVRAQDAKALAVACRGADGISSRPIVALGRARAEVHKRGLDLGIAERGELLAGRAADGDSGKALFDIAAVLLQVERHHRLDRGPLVGVEIAAVDEVVGQWAGLVERPRLKSGDEPTLVNQAVLQGKQAKKQVAIGSFGGHG